MQNRVFKAEVKAKVIALPAQEWIKSEIPTLASFALQDSSWRMNLLVIFYVGVVFVGFGRLFCCCFFFFNLSSLCTSYLGLQSTQYLPWSGLGLYCNRATEKIARNHK